MKKKLFDKSNETFSAGGWGRGEEDERGTVNGRENTGSGNSKTGESEGETKNFEFCHLFIYIFSLAPHGLNKRKEFHLKNRICYN